MMRKFKYLFLLCALAALASCSGHVEEENGTVPEGVLRIFVEGVQATDVETLMDEESVYISANGTDRVTFRVMYGSQDVTGSENMNLARAYEGGTARSLGFGVNEFTATTPGRYTITARYYDGTAVYSDNEVVVTVLADSEPETFDWYQKVLAMEFTSTTCSGCPALADILESLQSANSGVLSVAAFHLDYQGSDPMTIDHSKTFATEFLGTAIALPALFFNMHKPYGESMTNIQHVIERELATELKTHKPTCGIAVSSSFDTGSRQADITVNVKSNELQACRLMVLLVEHGIVAAQLDDADYVHNHVVRDVLSSGVYGDYMNDAVPLYPGKEYTRTYSVTLPADWNEKNMQVIVSVTTQSEDNGYSADNTNECDLVNKSSDYLVNN